MTLGRKKRGKYQPGNLKPYRLSRSKIDLFLDCPRCFHLDRRLGIGRPPIGPFNLNLAVDELLKKEFDQYRAAQKPHPLSKGMVPFQHPDLDVWRANFQGMTYLDPDTNFIITGAFDDLWQAENGDIAVVDYKATSRNYELKEVKHLSDSNKNQADIYAWLLQKNGFKVYDQAFFLYCNGKRSYPKFNAQLNFDINLIAYPHNTNWVSDALKEIKNILEKDQPPAHNPECQYCSYTRDANEIDKIQTLF